MKKPFERPHSAECKNHRQKLMVSQFLFFYLETSGSQQKQKQEKQNKGYKK